MKLILARHGETPANRDRLSLGRRDVPLTEKGRLQAEALAESLASLPIAAVYSSPLCRALDTARAIASHHRLEVIVDEDLTEMDAGDLDGLTQDEIQARYRDFITLWLSPDGAQRRPPGSSESLQDVQDRAWRAVQRLAERHDDETVVAGSHFGVIHAIIYRALGLPLTSFGRLRHDLAAASTLDLRDDRSVLVNLNDTCHLDVLGLA